MKQIEPFNVGDTIRVSWKIQEEGKSRVQPFEGVVLHRRGRGGSATFLVRHLGADGVGVERIFPLSSPRLAKLAVLKSGSFRRAKLSFLRCKKT
jgi:large subunit ribosomal protein L19